MHSIDTLGPSDRDVNWRTPAQGHSRPVLVHYENTPIQYAVIFHSCKNDCFRMKNYDIFLIFAQNITSTHDLCFRSKKKKCTLYTPVNPSFTI